MLIVWCVRLNPRLDPCNQDSGPFASNQKMEHQDAAESVARLVESAGDLVRQTRQWMDQVGHLNGDSNLWTVESKDGIQHGVNDSSAHIRQNLQVFVDKIEFQRKASTWTTSMLDRWTATAASESHRFATTVLALDEQTSELIFGAKQEGKMSTHSANTVGIGHSSSAPQLMDHMIQNMKTFQNFGVPECFMKFELMYMNCIYYPLLGSCCKVRADCRCPLICCCVARILRGCRAPAILEL